MTEIEKVLVQRDGMSREEAHEALIELRGRVLNGENPEELLEDELGLEPDFVMELLG